MSKNCTTDTKHTNQFFMKNFNLLLLFTLLSFFFSCKKETTESVKDIVPDDAISLNVINARNFYEGLVDVRERSDTMPGNLQIFSNIEPLWDFADTLTYLNSIPVLIVPCGQCYDKFPYNDNYYVFYKTDKGIKGDFVILQTDLSVKLDKNMMAAYTGRMILFDLEQQKFRKLLTFKNGQVETISGGPNFDGTVQSRTEDCFVVLIICTSEMACGCYTTMWTAPCWGGAPSGTTFYWDGSSGGNSGTTTTTTTGTTTSGSDADPTGWSGGYVTVPPGGGGGVNGPTITNYFDPQFFVGGKRKLMVSIYNLLKRECITDLTNQNVQNRAEDYVQYCANGMEMTEAAFELMDDMANDAYSACLQTLVDAQVELALSEQKDAFKTKFDHYPGDASECFADPCTPAENESCALEKITQKWLNEHPEHNVKIQQTLAAHPNNPDVLAHVQAEVMHMMGDDEYREFVEAT